MFLVIVGHVETYDFINRMIYSFHMPLFFVLSGFFLKPDHFGKKSIIKDFRSIMVPYFLTGAVICVSQFINFKDDFFQVSTSKIFSLFCVGISYNGDMLINFIGAIWFLEVLFLSKIITMCMLQCNRGRIYIYILSIISMAFTKITKYTLPFGILQAITVSSFIVIGYDSYRLKLLETITNKKFVYTIVVISIILSSFFAVSTRLNSYKYNLLSVLVSSFIVFSFLLLVRNCQVSRNCFSSKLKKIFVFCGRFSLVILCVHSVEHPNHWFNLPHNLFVIEIFVRFTYIVLLTYFLVKIKFVRYIFNIHK